MTYEHAVPEEEAAGSQYYVAEVTDIPPSEMADVGDKELILTDSHRAIGSTYTGPSYGTSPKELEILAGPFDCPPLPHVLALERWVSETKPEETMEHLPDDY